MTGGVKSVGRVNWMIQICCSKGKLVSFDEIVLHRGFVAPVEFDDENEVETRLLGISENSFVTGGCAHCV